MRVWQVAETPSKRSGQLNLELGILFLNMLPPVFIENCTRCSLQRQNAQKCRKAAASCRLVRITSLHVGVTCSRSYATLGVRRDCFLGATYLEIQMTDLWWNPCIILYDILVFRSVLKSNMKSTYLNLNEKCMSLIILLYVHSFQLSFRTLFLEVLFLVALWW